jgi:hypothetical protein
MRFIKILKNNCSKGDILLVSSFIIILFALFAYMAFFLCSDFSAHTDFAQEMAEGKRNYPGNFILYGLINFLYPCFKKIFFFVQPFYRSFTLCFILAVAVTYKFRWTYKHLPECTIKWKRFLLALSFLFIVAIPIPSAFITQNWYLGNFTPNVWHNSTTILLFPFAIALFAMSIKQLEEYSNSRNLWLLLLVFLNIFIKPSYFFVWICVYPLFLLIEYGFTSKFFKGLLPVIMGVILLFMQYVYIYYYNTSGEEAAVILKPFQGYRCFAPLSLLPWALLSSFLFPIVYIALFFKRLYRNKIFLFVYASLLVAIAIFLLFVETGGRSGHGNFLWQVVICAWLCFFVTFSDWLKNKKELMQSSNLKKRILYVYTPAAIFAVHVIAGIASMIRYIYTGFYF